MTENVVTLLRQEADERNQPQDDEVSVDKDKDEVKIDKDQQLEKQHTAKGKASQKQTSTPEWTKYYIMEGSEMCEEYLQEINSVISEGESS